MSAAKEIVKEGGTVICASECAEGIGSEDFKELLHGFKSPEDFMETIMSGGFFQADQWEVQKLAEVLCKCDVRLFSENLTREEIASCRCQPVDDLDREIMRALKSRGKHAGIAFIPDGPYTLVKGKSV